ncbi:DUF4258 domain-containing protein [Robiginitalea marina]|uniref:DUF4258 domain-containing protein n=1 Tax=Robiginitalea marina TaxID=2954105 RepID=A0ABT1AU93_9FLAO|nr:DUF4258 domain-containing protein [Robiginitalea marina]MCO5723589.1 DUF4258 domain-containing protein [Robiginitalea marina]
MPFLKRLGYFLIGLSLGLIFLAIFLRKKTEETGTEFCYLPNCRVLKELRSKPLLVDSTLSVATDSLFLQYLLKEGKVDFGQSDTRATPCKIYRVSASRGGKTLVVTLKNCESQTVLTDYREGQK